MPSVFAWKTLGTYIVIVHAITRKLIQAAGKKLEVDLADVKSRLKMQGATVLSRAREHHTSRFRRAP